jgi:SMI1 / KNR4 family (SUKH-1)
MGAEISLAERYRELAKRDRRFEIFGADKHRYKSTKVSEGEIKEFELVIGCELPDDYRQFLLDVGAGVGPYYGLWSFDEIREELNSIYEDYQDEYNVRARPCDPFELEESMFSTRISLKDDSELMDPPEVFCRYAIRDVSI